jgi:hypothetical protein
MIQSNSSVSFLGSSSCFFVYGNASLQKAEIICIADNPHDVNHATKQLQVIKKVGLDSLLLKERIPRGETLGALFDEDQEEEKELIFTGWEHHFFTTKIASLLKREKEILTLKKQIKDDMNKNRWGLFYSSGGPFFNLLEELSSDPKAQWREIITLMENGNMFCFLNSVEYVVSTALALNRRKIRKLFKVTFGGRVTLLESAIEKGLESHRKVILLVNGHFLLQSPFSKEQQTEVKKFESFLMKRKFVVFIPLAFAPDVLRSPSLNLQLKKKIQSLIPNKGRPGFEGKRISPSQLASTSVEVTVASNN